MGTSSAVLLCFLFGIVLSEKPSIGDSTQDSLVSVTISVTAEEYRACKKDGACMFTPRSVSLNEPGNLHDKLESASYLEICRMFNMKFQKLESKYPEVKPLKLRMMQMLDTEFSGVECELGEHVIVKILNILKNLVQKLEVEFLGEMHFKSKHIPAIASDVEEMGEEPEEITAEPDFEYGHPIQVGSIRGIPGIHFPNYTEIPITSFTCSDKAVPGFYADLETGCQVFHLCYEHRRESFLCPTGTIFNQPILACDYWYSANCSIAPNYYKKQNIPHEDPIPEEMEIIEELPEEEVISRDVLKFIPVRVKVTDISKFDKPLGIPKPATPVILKDADAIADKIFDGILSLGAKAISQTSDVLRSIPDPKEAPLPLKQKLAAKVFTSLPLSKAKVVTSAAKLSAATKIASVAAIASGKAKMTLPLVKTKVAAAAAIPLVKTKVAAVPVVKAKLATAAAIPLVKTKAAAAVAGPAVKAKVAIPLVKVATKKIPLVKGKLLALPLAKTKLRAANPAFKAKKAVKAKAIVKAVALRPKLAKLPLKIKSAKALPLLKAKFAKAAVSPLTKKALALGYLKLLKAKKLALMG